MKQLTNNILWEIFASRALAYITYVSPAKRIAAVHGGPDVGRLFRKGIF
jgi:hypothetical protein